MAPLLPSIDHEWTAWRLVGEQVIFLDLLQDRYFCLGEPSNSELRASIARGESTAWRLPMRLPKPEAWTCPDTGPPSADENRPDITGLAAALWIQRRLERRFRTVAFHKLLIEVRAAVEHRFGGPDETPAAGLSGIVRAFEQARFIRSAPSQCVPRSLALVLRCASLGVRAHAVVGVKTRPFEAHCWAQHGSVVLSDPLEDVIRFTPILVI